MFVYLFPCVIEFELLATFNLGNCYLSRVLSANVGKYWLHFQRMQLFSKYILPMIKNANIAKWTVNLRPLKCPN